MAYHEPKLVMGSLVQDYHGASHELEAKYLPAAFDSGRLDMGVMSTSREY
jgi:hypothetical protein